MFCTCICTFMYTNVNNSVLVSDHKSRNKWIKSVINAKMDNNFLNSDFLLLQFWLSVHDPIL